MILFKKISYRNFLSSGNQPTQINLSENQTTLIVGSNGSGKSTLLDALCFVLFNKAFRKITKPQLINSTNSKDCLVEIEFSIGTKEYKVVRGIKPNIFEIWVDGVLQNQSSATVDQQKQLEESILKLNYKSFTQIVILGSASFVPFMQLSAATRREIVEDLLDIKIFSSMNSVIKDKIRKINEEIKDSSFIEKTTEEKIEMQKSFIEELENRSNANIDANNRKISDLGSEIEIYMTENARTEEQIFKYTKEQEDVIGFEDKLEKLNNLKGKISQKVSVITKEHKFFTENTVCPTCTQTIEEKFRLNRIEDAQSEAKKLQKGFLELEDAIKFEQERERQFIVLSKEITKLTYEISQNNTRINLNQRQIRELESEIQTITNKSKNRTSERDELKKLERQLIEITKNKVKHKENISYYDFLHLLMKDGGIKAKIIQKYLPSMNQLINKYLQLMDFYINFTFDEEFKEIIKSPIYEDFSYDSFSEGEKMRINLAILFTWREIARLKNSVNTNILILDEVFDSSLDFAGTDYFTKIIKFMISNTNVFVISHKTDELIDKFDKVIKFEKVKGFSKMID
jgi:DNA repair exonuclease SbcCD ATPase subunit